jgi:hypothetical protein
MIKGKNEKRRKNHEMHNSARNGVNMGKKISLRSNSATTADSVPVGEHEAVIVDVEPAEIEVDEMKYDKKLGARVKTGNKVMAPFLRMTFEIKDVEGAPKISSLYKESLFNSSETGMKSKLYQTVERLGFQLSEGEEFDLDDLLDQEVVVDVVHREDTSTGKLWAAIKGPVVSAKPRQTRFGA